MNINPIIIASQFLLGVITLSACSSPAPLLPVNPASSPNTPLAQPISQPPAFSVQAKMTNKLHKISHHNIDFNLVSFDSRDYQLEVADQPNGPGSIWTDSQTVAKKKNAVAAINAGFFTPEGKPLGLVVENGVQRSTYNASSLGKGVYHTTNTGAEINRSHQWKQILETKPQHLLQTGPMLIEKSESTKGLSSQNSRPRSFIATDGNNHWIMGHASSCSLAQLGKALASLKIPGLKIVSALNLDGGRSSDLWVSSNVTNGPLTIRPFWNKSVRNFLILKRK